MAVLGRVSWLVAGLGLAVCAASCGESSGDASLDSAGPGGSGSGGEAAAGAPALLPGRPDGLPWLGLACRDAGDCGDQGLRCLTEDEDFIDGAGAPAGGLCTADCQTDRDCRAFDPSAVCATFGEAPLVLAYAAKSVRRLCVPGCSLGAPSGPTKCHGRHDLACRPFAPDHPVTCLKSSDVCPDDTFCFRGVCRELGCGPRCNADRDCGGGRHCNAFTGLCDAEQGLAVPLGVECAGEAGGGTDCGSGNCLEVDDAAGVRIKRMCTQTCTIGEVCAEGQGACVYPRFETFAVGDAGYCMQRCDCDDDCSHPADRCVPFDDPETEKAYDSRGVCDHVEPGATTLSCDAGQGGAGGASSAGGAGG